MTSAADERRSFPSGPEILDALYLTAYVDSVSPAPSTSDPRSTSDPQRSPDTGVSDDRVAPEQPAEPHPDNTGRSDFTVRTRESRTPHDSRTGSGSWPASPQLPGALGLARALKPLRLRRPSPHEWELDEESTAERAASDGLWLPVRRPVEERRLDLWLIVDANPSMALWQDIVPVFQELLENTAVFRAIRTTRVDMADAGRDARLHGDSVNRPEHLQSGSDSLVLIVTDGVASAWRDGEAAAFLHGKARVSPTAVLSLLPQELWEFTLPSAFRVQLAVPQAAAANRTCRMVRSAASSSRPGGLAPSRSGQAVPVPLLELTPASLGRWARLVGSPGGRHNSAVLLTSRRGDLGSHTSLHSVESDSETDLDGSRATWSSGTRQSAAREAVLSFMAKASPTAFQLACRLAAAPLNLPVMRLLQHSMPEAENWNLAEIMLFGLLHRIKPDTDVQDIEQVTFDFAEGVREELLALATRFETLGVLRQVSDVLGSRLDTSTAQGDTLLSCRADYIDPPVTHLTRPFVRPLQAALSALSGPYLERALRLDSLLSRRESSGQPEAQSDSNEAEVSTGPPVSGPDSESADPESRSLPVRGEFMPSAEKESSRQILSTQPQFGGNLPLRNRNFTGREELLAKLRRRLERGVTTAVLPEALHGMGGVGKSQIAIEYVYRYGKEYDLVWWIPAEQTNLVVQSLIELGEYLHLQAGANRSAVPTVLEALRRGRPYSNWLLVFDNAENPHEVRQFFPRNGPGRVLVTSRNSQWSTLASSLEVDVFTRTESVELIKRRSPQILDEAADRLADALGDLPLAVEQAAVWLAETGMPAQQYLELFETKCAELLEVAPPADYDLPVAAAWNVSLDRLREDHPAALQLLQICAFFAPEPIARGFFEAVRGVSAPPDLRAALDDPIKLSQAIREIGRYALARIDHRNSTIQVHRLVQRVLIEQMNTVERAEMRHCAHEILANADPRNPGLPDEWPRYSALLPHVRATRMVECEDGWARQLVLNEADFLLERSDYGEALEVAEEAGAIWRRVLGDDHEHVIAADQVRALALRWHNQYDAAYELQSELVDRCRRVLGERHENTQRALSVMAILLRLRGDFYGARELDQQAYQTTLLECGAYDPGTLQAAHNYTVSLRLAGDFEEALRIDADTYERRVEVLGDYHTRTLSSRYQMGLDLQELGRGEEARQLLSTLRDLALSTLGPEHDLTIRATRELSVTLRKLGDHEHARELSSAVLSVLRGQYGENSLETVRASQNHATDLRQTGDLDQAAELGRATKERCSILLGPEHPHTYATANNLAVTLRLLGGVAEARELDQAAVNGLSSVLSTDHPRTLVSRTGLASDLWAQGHFEHAHDMDATLLEVSSRVRGERHPATLAIMLNLSHDLKGLGRGAEAQELHERALAAIRAVHGPEHPAAVDAEHFRRANVDIDLLGV
ncbi:MULTISPECIES: FxSxx-COOH system tetratricopeptide repeat protein [unclassified Streptomyces]|uniref:FxSxx-COOH system tetratricopeptide repeat protein n=1 Tax=unclassified Streptomyces TaxID=2593676 RepID=UPI002255C0CB|nr:MULTISPECIES: FxSxx-COOH system tetratricopeptide repeat protein [unclassified Streptomyces]MCX4987875.1 FxSxx-COOH system tetratricopeptide repeat protein [Streptomyces sp. NBC_00568]MCX5006993.1 FxSxx-COOH system tetratricopeptide repeat protein [Streptomyces sp. NBC_00638]